MPTVTLIKTQELVLMPSPLGVREGLRGIICNSMLNMAKVWHVAVTQISSTAGISIEVASNITTTRVYANVPLANGRGVFHNVLALSRLEITKTLK